VLGYDSGAIPLSMDYHALQHSFKPERWLSDQKPRHLHVFSHGAHFCLGKDLAVMEIKLVRLTFGAFEGLEAQSVWRFDCAIVHRF